jgi:hypothetical protein
MSAFIIAEHLEREINFLRVYRVVIGFHQKVEFLQQSPGQVYVLLPAVHADAVAPHMDGNLKRFFNVLQILIVFPQQGFQQVVVFKNQLRARIFSLFDQQGPPSPGFIRTPISCL